MTKTSSAPKPKPNKHSSKFKHKKGNRHKPVFFRRDKQPSNEYESYSYDELLELANANEDNSSEKELRFVSGESKIKKPQNLVRGLPLPTNTIIQKTTTSATKPSVPAKTIPPTTFVKSQMSPLNKNKGNKMAKSNQKSAVKKSANEPISEPMNDTKKSTVVEEPPVDVETLLVESARRLDELNGRSIYIRPILPSCTLDQLQLLAPDAISIRVHNATKSLGKGFAFLEFSSQELCEKYISTLNGCIFSGAPLFAAPASRDHKPLSVAEAKLSSLFVTGLPRMTRKVDLKALFPKAISITLFHDDVSECTGSAEIHFSSEDIAKEAFLKQHNKLICGKRICVTFCHKKGAVMDSVRLSSLDELLKKAQTVTTAR